MIYFDEGMCRDLNAASRREWLETNGLGGYASSTMIGMNTRRYHGLLMAAVHPPTVRVLLLAKLEETLILDGQRIELATNRYPGVIHPQGYQLQTNFRLDPFPVFTYRHDEIEIVKTIFMLHGENTTVLRYHFHAPPGTRAALEIRPLVAFRDYHSMSRGGTDTYLPLDIESGVVRVTPRGYEHALYLAHNATRLIVDGVWYRNFEYAEEQARGFDHHEDFFNPFVLVFDLHSGKSCNIIASTKRHEPREAAVFEADERQRRQNLIENVAARDDYALTLRLAADQFIVRRGPNLRSVIAGYHWFTDWGRDTMISLTGLALALDQFDTAREILLAFAEYINEGLIPNRFPDYGQQPEYNTVDGTLWYVNAIGEFFRRTDDEHFVLGSLYSKLKQIIDCHERGTHYDIRVCDDGLLRAGHPGVQLTWMDAKIGDYVVTPRTGKPVEIQALWYNALRTVESLAVSFGDEATRIDCSELAEKARTSFNERFWNEAAGCLFDYINDDGVGDPSVRPNQIFAISLPHPILTGEKARRVVETVQRELLTPYGLRSLSPHHKDYRPRCEGDAMARDCAYHQGTIWSWLMGPFITAYLKVNDRTTESVETARQWTQAFRDHLFDAGLGQISEVFDGDPPHTPRACIAQAWSVAELLRCELEELV